MSELFVKQVGSAEGQEIEEISSGKLPDNKLGGVCGKGTEKVGLWIGVE